MTDVSLLHCLVPMIPLGLILVLFYYKLISLDSSIKSSLPKWLFGIHLFFNLYGITIFVFFAYLREGVWLASYGEALSFTALLISILQWSGALYAKTQPIGLFSMFPTLLLLLSALILPTKFWAPHTHKALFHWHLFFSLTAYALFSVGFILAMIFLSLDKRLKQKKFDSFFQNLPALGKVQQYANLWVGLALVFSIFAGISAVLWKGQVQQTSFTLTQKLMIYLPLLSFAGFWILNRMKKVTGARYATSILWNYGFLIGLQILNFLLY